MKSLTIGGNFNAISNRREGSMSPARTTVVEQIDINSKFDNEKIGEFTSR